MQEEIILNKAHIREIYNNSSREEQGFLEKIFGTEPFDFDYREIKSFEDACKHLGISSHVPTANYGFNVDEQVAKQCEAMYKLSVICKALCNGKYTDENGYVWHPIYFCIDIQDMAIMNEEKRKAEHIQLVSASFVHNAGDLGIACTYVKHRNDPNLLLCANSEEMAKYLDEQFRDLIFQLYGIEFKKEN